MKLRNRVREALLTLFATISYITICTSKYRKVVASKIRDLPAFDLQGLIRRPRTTPGPDTNDTVSESLPSKPIANPLSLLANGEKRDLKKRDHHTLIERVLYIVE